MAELGLPDLRLKSIWRFLAHSGLSTAHSFLHRLPVSVWIGCPPAPIALFWVHSQFTFYDFVDYRIYMRTESMSVNELSATSGKLVARGSPSAISIPAGGQFCSRRHRRQFGSLPYPPWPTLIHRSYRNKCRLGFYSSTCSSQRVTQSRTRIRSRPVLFQLAPRCLRQPSQCRLRTVCPIERVVEPPRSYSN